MVQLPFLIKTTHLYRRVLTVPFNTSHAVLIICVLLHSFVICCPRAGSSLKTLGVLRLLTTLLILQPELAFLFVELLFLLSFLDIQLSGLELKPSTVDVEK